ncbi:MAG: DNA methyltransferase, partial [Chloroflexota bacterium]
MSTAPQAVLDLVERFERNLDLYKRQSYKEARVRIEFIDPFFEALGWDVRNVRGLGEPDKDVVYEDTIKIAGKTRAPDYSFRVGQKRKFFLEAKKPAISLEGDIGPAYQVRRYSWNVKLPLGILTDFEEFAIYDCRYRPRPTDKASVARVTYMTFDQYMDRWDEIHDTFAKESVIKGSFDRYAEETKHKRGTSEVDDELLKDIEGWRDTLARNIALRNHPLSIDELNFAVQRTIDRIIFLRICEDRGIEEYGRLLALIGGPHIYARMGELYRQADEKYNAGLFDFQADTLTRTLTIDDKVLKPILGGLYLPQCPYEFSVLPADVLGQVYEQFLGKVIRLTAGHRAKVEEKPEVKKAGGVYYTPTYIVDYIVKQTVGKLIEGKPPRQIAKLRILDPACGSGSFLLGAYQYLLDYHLRWHEAHDPEKRVRAKQPPVYQGPHGEWRLTSAEKKQILLNNIYGVDVDRQAVEVTKLSLLLKVLEGESQETLGQQLALWQERALPDLGDNIKCGNSLIGHDYFEVQLLPDEEEMRRVNPFDWETGFRQVMASGGFDAVIGNPPWISLKGKFGAKLYPSSDVDY